VIFIIYEYVCMCKKKMINNTKTNKQTEFMRKEKK